MRTLVSLVSLFALTAAMHAQSSSSLYDIPLEDIDGNSTTLAEHQGKVMLIVNVASKCGFTRQYKGLETLYDEYKDEGLVVLGFPSNQFNNQEPGTEEEIKEFCELTFGVTFPMYSKVDVNGPDRHPLYQALAGPNSPTPGDIGWNFNKFLVSKEGKILQRFESKVDPQSDQLVSAVKAAL